MIKKIDTIQIVSIEELYAEILQIPDYWSFRGQAHDWPIKSGIDRCLDEIKKQNANALIRDENQNASLEMWIFRNIILKTQER